MAHSPTGNELDFSDVIIHVGYHKAGSTLLQTSLFTRDHGFSSPWEQSFYHQNILLDRPDPGWSARVRSAYLSGIEDARGAGLVPVLSCEALSGDIWRRGQANGYGNFHVAQVLAEAFPGARVVIVHREQAAMIASLYKHSLRSHWRFSLANFVDQSSLKRGVAPFLNLGYLEYSWLAARYRELFSPDHVLAVPFELIRTVDRWSATLSDFCGVPVEATWFSDRQNPGMSALTVRVKRRANYFIPATATPNATATARAVNRAASQIDRRLPPGPKAVAEHRLEQQIDSLLGDRFAEDNARLFELLDEDWSTYGYRTPGRTTEG